MKKAITTIMSALLLISCLTVNVFATNSEGEDSGNLSATQTSSSETNEEYQATQYSENVESMNLVIPGSDDNNTIVPLTKRSLDENNSSYEWYISPDLEMFTQKNYLDFCKSVANKEQSFYLEYTPVNGPKKTVQSADISISEPGNSNDVKRTSTVFETTVVFAEYTKQNLLYARSIYFDNNEIRYSDYIPTSQDEPINIEIYNNQRYILFYGNDYDSNTSTDDIVLNRSTDGIGIGTNENFNIRVTENDVFEVSSTHSGSSVSVSYADQTLTFTSVLPNVGVYSSTERSDSSYCRSYNDNNRVFYINWDNNSVSSISLNAIRRNNNYTYESNEYKTTLMENANSLKIEFNEGINIEGGLEIQLTVNPRNGNAYSYNPRIDYEAGNTLYARNTYYGENNEIKYNERAETSFNGDVFVDIYNNQKYALYFGSNYDNNVSPESERISNVTVSQNNGMTISEANGLLSVYSERSGSYATITYEGRSLTFRSRLPEVGIYTSNVIADEAYCTKYNDNRREFYINWNNSWIQSVSIISVSGYEPNVTYNSSQYSITTNNNSLKLSFKNGVDITKGGLSIKVSVNYKNGQPNEFYIGCQYDSEYIENADYIIRDNQIFYSTVYNNRTYYVSKDIFSKFDSIKDNLSINEQTQNILISFSNTDNYEMNNNSVFFDHGAYFRIDKILSLSAYNVSNPATDELTADKKISFTNPIVLDIDYRNTSIDYAETNTYLFTKTDGIYNKTYNKVSNNTNQGNSTLQANEYYWYGDQYTTSIKLSSNFYEPIVFATRLYDSDFKVFNDNFSIQKETVSSQEDLQNKIDLQFTVGGSELTLGDNITLNKDLRITNFADFSMNDVGSNNFNNSLLIDLNGKTINLGNYKIVLSENSTVHIKNGKIIGDSDSLIDNYGGLSLHDVDLINESESRNSYAIKTYRGVVFIDENTTITAYNGINLTDSYYYRTFDNSCWVSGSINVAGNGVVFEEKETYNQDFLNVMVPNYINQEIQNNNYQVLNDIEPKVIAGGTAIITSNKTNIMLAGTSYYEEANDGTYVEYLAKTTISGNKAILVKSGELRIGGNIDIISNATGDTNIEVVSSGLNNDDFLDININVSQKTNFVSYGNLIKESGTAGRNISLVITCQEHINDSKFVYVDNNPFEFNSAKVSYDITAGLYSTNGIGSYMDTNEYRLVGPNNGFYEITINSNDPYDFEYEWNDNQSPLNNLNNLEYYLTNLGTKNIYIKSFNNTSVTPKAFTITRSKNILIDDGVTLNDVTFVVDANGKEVHINNGTINNTSGTCLVVENGEVYINANLVSNGSTEAIKVTGGELHFDPGASAKGSVALNIEATSSIPKVDVCGDLEGTGGVAIKYAISDNLTVDYDNYALNIVGQNNPNGYSTILGGILAENGKVTTMHANITADVAFELQGNSQLVFGKDTHVTGNEVGVFLNGSGTFFFDEGILESKHPVKILDNSYGKYQVVFMDRVHCKVLENGSGRVINTINNIGEIRNTNERISYNVYCELAYFNVPVDEKQFNNLNMKMNQGTAQEGMYTSVQYDSLSVDYPYCIAYKLDSVKHNSLSLNFTNNNDIKVEASKLDGLKQNQGNNEWTLLVIEEANIPESSDNLLEAYDIQVRDIDENKNVSLISETSDYQIIIIPVQTDDIEKVNIGHKHGDDPETILAKVSKQDALSNQRECYFVNNDSSVGIITKRFSTFGIYSNDNVILPEASAIESPQATSIVYGQKLNESALSGEWKWLSPETEPVAGEHNYDVYLKVTNSDKYDYSKIEGYDPTTNRIVRTITITVNKATPIYNPTGLTATYNDTLSVIALDQGWQWLEPDRVLTEIGEVTAKAKFDATDNYLASEKDLTITVTKKQASVPPISTAKPVVYGVTLANVALSDPNWKWVDNTIKPTVTNDGYKAYINVDDAHYKWDGIDGYDSTNHRYVANISVTVSKANPIDENPDTLIAVYGDKLSQFKLTGGWYWENSDIVFNNIGSMTVIAKIDETDNYNESTKEVKVTVNKKQAEIPIKPTAKSVVYGVTLKDVELSDTNWKWVDDTIKPTVTNNGYQAYIEVDDVHYNWEGIKGYDAETHKYFTYISVSVSKADPKFTVPTNLTATYGSKLSSVTLPTGWSWVDGTQSVGNATATGNKFVAKYNPDADNYNDALVELTVIVNKTTPVYTIPSGLTATYGDKLSSVTLESPWKWIEPNRALTELGVVTFKAKIEETENYFGVEKDLTIKVYAKKAVIPAIPTAKSVVYGVTLADISLSDSNWHWIDNTIKPTVSNDGYQAYIKVDDTNYNWTGIDGYDSTNHRYVANIPVLVSKADPKYSVPTNLIATYGNTLSNVNLPTGWSWVDGTQSVGYATSEGRKFKARFTPSDTDNYNEVILELNVVVNKADPIDTNSDTLTAVYGDKLSQYKLTGGWYWENGDIVFNNIGSMTVIAKIDATDNYKSSTKEVTVTVNKKKAETPVKPTAKSVVYGVTLSDVTLSDSNWAWVDETIKPTVTNNGYKAYIEVDDTHYDWEGIAGYDSANHRYEATLSVKVSKAVQDKTKITIPVIKNVEKGTLLEKIDLPVNWKWEKSSNVVSDSNYAIYNPDDANYVDLLVSIPVSIKETVGDKTVSISNIVSSSDEKGIEEVAVKNDGISKSVVDAVANTADTNTKINNKEVTDLIKAADDTTTLNISTEFIKNTVTESEDINNAISKVNVKTDEVAMVLDLKIQITVDNGTAVKTGNITELAEPVELTFKLPEGSKTTAAEGKELKYYVLVIHGDDVLKIPATLNAADGTVTFSADKFSTYILVSEEVAKTVAENSTPSYVPSANKKPVVNTAAK